jgi:hypothetical protein
MITQQLARDEMTKMFYDAWLAQAALAIEATDAPPVFWQGVEEKVPPAQDKPYARFAINHVLQNQSSLSNENGVRKWQAGGQILIQTFGPMSGGNGLQIAEALAIVAKNAYQGKSSPGGIWFRNCRANEVGPTDGWYQFNMIADFTYEELR